MPDNDRRNEDFAVRERLARLETATTTTNDELGKLRPVVHELVSVTTSLNLMAEEARESRANLARKLDEIVAKIDPMVVAVAQGATTVAMHIQNCNEIHKASDERQAKIEAQSDQRHEENQEKMGKIQKTIYIATGVALVIGAAASHYLPLLLKVH